MTNRLPEKLTALRKHFGYSQGDLATKLQVPVAEYMNWENGNSICRIEQLRYLASLYRVPIEDLASNVRSVTLPRLDEDDDSIDIAFGGKGGIPSMSDTLPLTAEIDLADNLISPGVMNPEPASYDTAQVKTDDDENTLEFEETVVNQIVDHTAEVPRPKKEARKPEPETYGEAEEAPAKDRSRMYLYGGLAAGALVLVLAVMFLFGGSRSRTNVDISNVNRLALGGTYSMYLSSEGKLVTAGQNIPALDSKDLVQVSAATSYAMGLRKDGTVVCSSSGNVGKVDDWKDIVMIAAGENHSVGLKKDGTVECNGSTGACTVSDWKDVAAVYAGNEITIGITDKGTALVSGSFSSADKIRQMKNIRSVDLGSSQIVITGSDGSVACVPIGNSSVSNTAAWTGISTAAAGGSFAAGLSGGKVTVATTDDEMVRTVSEWSGIQYIAARNNTLIAVNSQGKVIGAGDNSMQVYGENDAEPEPVESAEPEKAEKLSQPANLRFTVTSANLQLSWDAVIGADYYTVVVNSSPETSLKTEKPSASISTDKLRSGSTYIVTITACAKDTSKKKNSDALIQQYAYEANLTRLATPSGITVTQEGETIQVSWNPVSNAQYYEVTIEDMTQNVSTPFISVDLTGRPDGNFSVYVTAYPGESDTRYTFSETASASGTYQAVKKELSQAKIVSAVPGRFNTWTLTWNYVDNAANYTVAVNGTAQTVTENYVTLFGLPDGEYMVQITANPKDLSKYTPSVSSDKWTYTSLREETPKPVTPEPTQEPAPDPEETGGEKQEGGSRE